jgi:hypothetical protein
MVLVLKESQNLKDSENVNQNKSKSKLQIL